MRQSTSEPFRAAWTWYLTMLTGVLSSEAALQSCHDIDLAMWVSPRWVSKGYHVLCVDRPVEGCAEGGGETCPARGGLSANIFWGGHYDDQQEINLAAPESLVNLEKQLTDYRPPEHIDRFRRIRKALDKKGSSRSVYGFFRVKGPGQLPVRMKSNDEVTGLVLIFEGGEFLWPGIEMGFKRNITITAPGSDPLELELLTRHLQPLIVEVSSFLEEDECDHVIKKAEPHVAVSTVSHMDHDVGKPSSDWRTSSTYFMPSDDDILERLDRRVSLLTRIKVTHQEQSQILRYQRGQRYAAHHDYFDYRNYKNDPMIASMTKKGLFNRLATVFFYLTTVEAGGQTNFPRAGALPQPRNFEDCDKGVSVDPKRGRIIIFYSLTPDGSYDEYSLHGGCAVVKGTKWSANKWIWNKPMGYTSGDDMGL